MDCLSRFAEHSCSILHGTYVHTIPGCQVLVDEALVAEIGHPGRDVLPKPHHVVYSQLLGYGRGIVSTGAKVMVQG